MDAWPAAVCQGELLIDLVAVGDDPSIWAIPALPTTAEVESLVDGRKSHPLPSSAMRAYAQGSGTSAA
jgi:hypothetical protein